MKRPTDYPELEGKIIDYYESKKAYIVGVNYDIGITMVNAENHEEYLSCYRGPSITKPDDNWGDIFYAVVDEIEAGKYTGAAYDLVKNKNAIGDNPSSELCPWNQ